MACRPVLAPNTVRRRRSSAEVGAVGTFQVDGGPLIVPGDNRLLLEREHERAAECRRVITTFEELARPLDHVHTLWLRHGGTERVQRRHPSYTTPADLTRELCVSLGGPVASSPANRSRPVRGLAEAVG